MNDEKTLDEQLRMEREGVNAGLNPMFGEWQQAFNFAPVPYGDGGAKRQAFRQAMQAELTNRWLYSHEIHLEIILYLDVQNVLETSETADLDNYAKAILDGLKGPNGVMFDDTQVQSLSISWLDAYEDPKFTVTAKGSPDEFVLKPTEFYEMPDGLWYPHGRYVWSEGGKEPMTDRNHFVGLSILELMSSIKKRARVEMRRARFDRVSAYQGSEYVSSLARGFHRSRVEESGFALHSRKEWQAERENWKAANPGEMEQFDEILDRTRGAYERMIDLLAGRLPSTEEQNRA